MASTQPENESKVTGIRWPLEDQGRVEVKIKDPWLVELHSITNQWSYFLTF